MRHEYLSVYNLKNHTITSDKISVDEISVGGGGYLKSTYTADKTDGTGTYNLFNISGAVRFKLIPICTTSLVGDEADSLGFNGVGTELIAATTVSNLDAGEFWTTHTGMVKFIDVSDAFDMVVADKTAIDLVVGTGSGSEGVIDFHLWWEPIEEGATVVEGDGFI
jgi:hypothetical protein